MPIKTSRSSNYRWIICGMLFLATTVNYLDRQVLSLTWKDFIAPEFGWNDDDYGLLTGCFSIMYALFMFFAGRFVDGVGTKRGYMVSVGLWSLGAVMHAFCGIATCGIITGEWLVLFDGSKEVLHDAGNVGLAVSTISIYLFLACRIILALGEAGNFPAAIKVTAEYFPKKDRAFATSIFNNGASVGALIAPVSIPLLAKHFGWEMSFLIIGSLGYAWMLLWLIVYDKPQHSRYVNMTELNYINQDAEDDKEENVVVDEHEISLSIGECLMYRQTWAFIFGKFMTDGVWWFFLFWTPAYISDVYGYSSDSVLGMSLIFVLYLITMLSVVGGYLPTYFIDHAHMNPYDGRMRAMFIFALIPLSAVIVQPLGTLSPWFPILLIGILGAAHQSWSANIFSMVGDLFPKSSIATVVGIGGMAGGLGAFLINYGSGSLFTYSEMLGKKFIFLGFEGKQGGYMVVFSVCAIVYLLGWLVMKMLVPMYKPVVSK